MNARSYFSTDAASLVEPIDDLSRVALLRSVATDRGDLPEGSKGTVVSVYDDGAAYCVEFHQPIVALVTVLSGDLVAVVEDDLERLAGDADKIQGRH